MQTPNIMKYRNIDRLVFKETILTGVVPYRPCNQLPERRKRHNFSLLVVLVFLMTLSPAWADPHYGTSFTCRGETFNWVSGYGEYTDYYTSEDGGTMTISGDSMGYVAGISGSNSYAFGGGSISGQYFSGNAYFDDSYSIPANSSSTISIHGQSAALTGGYYTNTYYYGGGSYGNSVNYYSGEGCSGWDSYSWDMLGSTHSYYETFNFTDETPSTFYGRPITRYQITGTNTSVTDGNGTTTTTESADYWGGGPAYFSYTYSSGESTYSHLQGYDPRFGGISDDSFGDLPSTLSSQAPSFCTASNYLWVDSAMVTFSSGEVSDTGLTLDGYSGGFSIYGDMSGFFNGETTDITVVYNETEYYGTVSGTPAEPVFTVSGLDIQTSDPNP